MSILLVFLVWSGQVRIRGFDYDYDCYDCYDYYDYYDYDYYSITPLTKVETTVKLQLAPSNFKT